MGLYITLIVFGLVIFYQNEFVEARACNGRNTVIQVRVPDKTDVTVKYPSQIDPVQFVPRPSQPDPQCFKCSGSKCQKCNKFNPNAQTMPNRSSISRTNIVIDLKGHHNKNDNPKKDIYDTLVYVGDKNSASSVSNSTAKSEKGAAATTSAAASTTNTALIAAFGENPNSGSSPGNTENVYVEDTSQSSAKSSASASAGNLETEEIITPEPTTVADQDQPSQQQPQVDQAPDQQPASEQKPHPEPVPESGQKLVPEKETASEKKQPTKEEETAGEKTTPQKTGDETNLDKDKKPESNPKPKADDDEKLETPSETDKEADAAPDTVLSSPSEIGKTEESAKEPKPDVKKEENNPPADETASP